MTFHVDDLAKALAALDDTSQDEHDIYRRLAVEGFCPDCLRAFAAIATPPSTTGEEGVLIGVLVAAYLTGTRVTGDTDVTDRGK